MEKVSKQLEVIEEKLAEGLNRNNERIQSLEQKIEGICLKMAAIDAKNTQNIDRIASLENALKEPRRDTQMVQVVGLRTKTFIKILEKSNMSPLF